MKKYFAFRICKHCSTRCNNRWYGNINM